MSRSAKHEPWGRSPWKVNFTPARHKPVAVCEAAHIGAGASGRTGGMVLSGTAAGDQPGLGDVLAGFRRILEKLKVHCDLHLEGAWEIARQQPSGKAQRRQSPIEWNDSCN